jgi:polynucleotide 5'-triphosphatase
MSYLHEEFRIDLTQVTASSANSSQTTVSHELELEFQRPEFVLAAAHRRGDLSVSELERDAFDELMRAFVNNAHILVRNAPLPH